MLRPVASLGPVLSAKFSSSVVPAMAVGEAVGAAVGTAVGGAVGGVNAAV